MVQSQPIIDDILTPDGIEFLLVRSGELILSEIPPNRIAGNYRLGVTTNILTIETELTGNFDVTLEDIR